MRRLLVGYVLLCVVSSFAADPPRPLVDSVTVSQRENAVIEVQSGGFLVKPATGPEVSVSDTFCIPPDDPDKPDQRTKTPGVIFKNTTNEAWTVRVVPTGADGAGAACHTLQCARTLAQLKDPNGLCDRSPDNSDQCITSAAALGSCFGPECNAARAKCRLEGTPQDRTCTLSVQELIGACNENWCGRQVRLDPYGAQPGQYLQRTEGVAAPEESEGLPAAIFPPESIGKAPYRFFLESDSGAFRRLTINIGDASCPTLQQSTTTFNEVAVVPLDNTGVASWVYLNPNNPACLTCDGSEIRALAFENRTSDRAFTVSIDLPLEVSAALTGEGCTVGKPCKLSRTIEPNNATVIEPEILKLVPEKTLLRFKVSFADEVEKPSNPIAYIRIKEEVADASSDLVTSFVTRLGGQLDPFVAAVPETVKDEDGDGLDDTTKFKPCYVLPADYKKENEPALCAGNRIYTGDHARHYTAGVRVDLQKPLGRQADISASVTYRTSDFGVDDGNVAKLSDYGVNVYGPNAIFARFGRTTWANPSNSIAIFEKGDGFRFTYKNLSVAHVIKRESEKAPADDDNRDHKSFIAQVKSFPVNRWGGKPTKIYFFRGLKLLDLTAVRGEDKASHLVYRSFGGELFYTFRNPVNRPRLGTLTGSVAAYRSTRHLSTDTVAGTRHGKGWVGLFTATWIPKTQSAAAGGFEAKRSYTAQFGKGSSDDPDTPDTSEDYIGEGGSFAGDTLLMSTFASKIDVKGHVIVGPSLANKRYLGLQIVDNTWSLLDEIAKLFDVGPSVNSRSTTFRVRNYTFGRPVYANTHSRDAVTEFALEFAVEIPKGVRTTFGAGYMHTGRGIEPVIDNDTWVVTTGVSLTL